MRKSNKIADQQDTSQASSPKKLTNNRNIDLTKMMVDAETGEQLRFSRARWNAEEGRVNLDKQTILAMGTGKLAIKSRDPTYNNRAPAPISTSSTSASVSAQRLAASEQGNGFLPPIIRSISAGKESILSREKGETAGTPFVSLIPTQASQQQRQLDHCTMGQEKKKELKQPKRHELLTQFLREGPRNVRVHRHWHAATDSLQLASEEEYFDMCDDDYHSDSSDSESKLESASEFHSERKLKNKNNNSDKARLGNDYADMFGDCSDKSRNISVIAATYSGGNTAFPSPSHAHTLSPTHHHYVLNRSLQREQKEEEEEEEDRAQIEQQPMSPISLSPTQSYASFDYTNTHTNTRTSNTAAHVSGTVSRDGCSEINGLSENPGRNSTAAESSAAGRIVTIIATGEVEGETAGERGVEKKRRSKKLISGSKITILSTSSAENSESSGQGSILSAEALDLVPLNPKIAASNVRSWAALEEKIYTELSELAVAYEVNKSLTKERPSRGGLGAVHRAVREVSRQRARAFRELAQAVEDERNSEIKRQIAEQECVLQAKKLEELRKTHEKERERAQRYITALQTDNEIIFIRKLGDLELLW